MNEPTLGKLIEGDAKRDAIHIAIAPVVAFERLWPAQAVGLTACGRAIGEIGGIVAIGIVDPFLTHPIAGGDRFWLFLFPRTITSLRHDWTHPAFELSTLKAEAEKFLRDLAKDYDFDGSTYAMSTEHAPDAEKSFRALMRSMNLWADGTEQYAISHGRDLHGFQFDFSVDELWRHYENYTGRKAVSRETYFSCTC